MFIICKKSVCIEGKNATVYGVKTESLTIDDVSSDLASVERLVTMLNSNDISTEHLTDIIEDFIAAN